MIGGLDCPPAWGSIMKRAGSLAPRRIGSLAATLACCLMLVAVAAPARAGCNFEPQGEGRVTQVTDGRSFRLSDGREVRLAGIEAVAAEPTSVSRTAALSAIIAGHEVTLRGPDDTPDRYGRQPAFVFLDGSDTSVQGQLLEQGHALVSADVSDKDCASSLAAAEAAARQARRGIWTDSSVIKSAESPGDILAMIGRFIVVEGKVLSVRQAGATTYLNFGRNWTRGFAATISKRMTSAFGAAGTDLKSLENRRIRVRGWVEMRGGPRIEVLRTGQIELVGEN